MLSCAARGGIRPLERDKSSYLDMDRNFEQESHSTLT